MSPESALSLRAQIAEQITVLRLGEVDETLHCKDNTVRRVLIRIFRPTNDGVIIYHTAPGLDLEDEIVTEAAAKGILDSTLPPFGSMMLIGPPESGEGP